MGGGMKTAPPPSSEGKHVYSRQPAHAAKARGRDPRTFGAEEASTFEPNISDAAAEKRKAYAPGKKAPVNVKPPASESTGRSTPRRIFYSARPTTSAARNEVSTSGRPYHVQENYYASAAPQRSPPTRHPDGYSAAVMARPISARVVEDEEADIEARVQERVQRQSHQIAQQIREELAQGNASAGGTGATSAGAIEGSEDRDQGDDTCCGFNKWVVIGLVSLAVLLVGGVGAAVAVTSSSNPEVVATSSPTFVTRPGTTQVPSPPVAPVSSRTPAPSRGATDFGGASCTLCEDGTTPGGLDDKTILGGDQTCAEFSLTLEGLDPTDDLCDVNQAVAWLYCDCPTLPPPVEDPACTMCENGAAPVGITRGICSDLQTYIGITSSTLSSFTLACQQYLEAAAAAECECPEGPVVGTSTIVPSAPPLSDGSTVDGFTPNPTPSAPSAPPVTDGGPTLAPSSTSTPVGRAFCTLCDDGTIPDDLESETIGIGDNILTCAEFALESEGLDTTNPLCDVNQAVAWLYCGCPTLPPPVEDPTCTICQNGAGPVGSNADICSDFQTYAGITSSTSNSFRLTCNQYLQLASAVDCECPEGPIQA